MLCKTIESFFSIFILVFKLDIFFTKMIFRVKKFNFQTAYFFQNLRIEKNYLQLCSSQNSASFDTNINPVSSKTVTVRFFKSCKIETFQLNIDWLKFCSKPLNPFYTRRTAVKICHIRYMLILH